MAKWLVVKLADNIPEEKLHQLLTDMTNHQAFAWYESIPDVFKNSEALDKAKNTWLADRRQRDLINVKL